MASSSGIERRHELIAPEVFSAQDPVGIEHPDLDVLDAAFGQKVTDFDRVLQACVPRECYPLTSAPEVKTMKNDKNSRIRPGTFVHHEYLYFLRFQYSSCTSQ